MKINNANIYSVYIHITPSNKRYIGITSRAPEQRWNNGEGYSNSKYFYRAIKKYGWENIQHIIISENLSFEEAAEQEKALIKKYDTTNRNNGYNICSGGQDGWIGVHHTEETKKKMSLAKKGKVFRKGYHYSAESRRKMSEAHKGKYHGKPVKPKKKPIRQYDENGKIIFSEEHKKRISKSLKGIKRSAEVRMNMSKAQIKTKKPVICIDTGEVFESQTAAMKHFNIDKTLIGRCCKNKQKTAKGLRFEYV